MVIAFITVFTAMVAGLVVPLASPAAADAGAEADFLARLNDLRENNGLAPLASHSELVSVARRWSSRMAGDNRLSHNSNLPNEVTADWEKLAENVGVGPTVAEIHDAFVKSSSHRVNMVESAFTHIGVGVVTGPDGKLWVTHIFMRLGGAPAPPPKKAAPPATTTTTTTSAAAAAPAAPAPKPRTASPAPAPRPAAAAPVVTTPVTVPVEAVAEAVPAPPPTPTPRLVLILDGLRSLDRG